MAKLLVLSLAETNRNDDGYEVIAKNIENQAWVIIPSLPSELLEIDGKIAWDIFAVTEADLNVIVTNRGGIYSVDVNNYLPRMIHPPIIDNNERIRILESLASDSASALSDSPSWVGILKEADIKDIIYRERHTENFDYDESKTFFWECRLIFNDKFGGSWRYRVAPGVACKDMRFKAYWRDVLLNRRDKFLESKEKWLNYMQVNTTYLLIEFIPNEHYRHIAVVSGVLCINNQEMILE